MDFQLIALSLLVVMGIIQIACNQASSRRSKKDTTLRDRRLAMYVYDRTVGECCDDCKSMFGSCPEKIEMILSNVYLSEHSSKQWNKGDQK